MNAAATLERPAAARGATRRSHRGRLLALLLIAVFYAAIPNARPDFTRFNAHDSEFYLALAHSMAHGRGYTRSLIPDMYVPHRTWPPGLPMLMVPAMRASGETIDWRLVKWTAAAIGLAGIVFTWLLLNRLSGQARIADLGALVVALSPFYWDFSHQVMTEVPTITWMVLCLLVCDHVFACRRPTRLAVLATGVGCGLGMLLKGHVLGLALVPLAYCFGPRAMRMTPRERLLAACIFFAGFTVPFAAWSIRSAGIEAPGWDGVSLVQQLFTRDGGADTNVRSVGETIAHVVWMVPSFAIYRVAEQTVPFLGLEGALEWPGSGWLALLVCGIVLIGCWPRPLSREYLGLHIVIVPAASLNLLFSHGGAARYWVPISLLLLLVLVLRHGWRVFAHRPALTAGLGSAILVVNLGVYVAVHERQPYEPDAPWRELAELFELAGQQKLQPVGILSPNHHALQLMTGYPAPMLGTGQYDPWFDHMVARVDGKGLQPPPSAEVVVSRHPWALYRLPAPMRQRDLVGDRRLAFGIDVDPY